jgi:hypothetical protein
MNKFAMSIYYSLAFVVVGATSFVLSPSDVPEMTKWQDGVKQEFMVAFQQTVGDQPWFSEFELVFDSVNQFYTDSTDAVVALLNDAEADEDIIYVFGQVYQSFAKAINQNKGSDLAYENLSLPPMPSNFMAEESIYNIVPYRTIVKTIDATSGQVAGANSEEQVPVNSPKQPWVTIEDNSTGQLYCLAVYNGTVNNYLGACKNDYY